MKLSIIIPVYNEVATLEKLLARIAAVELPDLEKEIILVDDGSIDGSRQMLEGLDKTYRVLFHSHNRGKGRALRTGFAVASGDFVIVQDADLEYDPEDYKLMLKTLRDENLNVLYGSRVLEKRNRSHSSLPAYLGARCLTFLTNLLYQTELTDEPTCYKLFRREFLESLDLKCEHFEFCPEVTAKIALRKIAIREVPIRYYPRSHVEGKKIGWRDFIEAVRVLLTLRFAEAPEKTKDLPTSATPVESEDKTVGAETR